mgnify:CR=1 FL=1
MTSHLPKKSRRKRRTHSAEFKAEVVALCQEPDASRAEIARRFDLNDNLVHKWCMDAKRENWPTHKPDFIKLPAPPITSSTEQTVLLELMTPIGQLKVHWPLNQIHQSVHWIKALDL